MKIVKSYECQICGRALTDPVSIARGAGDECAEKRTAFVAGCGATEGELATIAGHPDEYVNRWARYFQIEMRRGNTRGAKRCLEVARHLLAAEMRQAEQADTPMLKLVQNNAATVRWSNDRYAEAAKAAGGVLVIKKEAA